MMIGLFVANLLVFAFLPSVLLFNIDIDNWFRGYDIGNKPSMFGYSVSLINNRDTPLIVGAPDYDSAGAIFKCGADGGQCEEVLFADTSGKSHKNQTDGQKFGFTLSQVGKRLMACAPKFKAKVKTHFDGNVTQPLGKCSVFDENMKFKYSEIPCKEFAHYFNHYKLLGFGYSFAGTSAAGMPTEATDPMYYVGTPGARHLTGLILSFHSLKAVKATEKVSDYFDKKRRNSYIGYSVSAGNVVDRNTFGDVMVGAPRGNNLNGHAVLYKYKNKNEFSWKTNIFNPHEQIGSYFGGSVCVIDTNSDRKDDVLIGAPYYSKIRDEGRVYVYENIGDSTYDVSDGNGYKYKGLRRSGFLDGDDKLGSRFGTTVVNLGDLNKDGYNDVAIGAPGGDIGAVYIYNGGDDGLKNKYSQVIYASSVPGTPKGFGISIASGIDIDGNTYNDIAIGAYLAGKAYVFKSRPIIRLDSSLSTSKSIIKPEERFTNCNWKGVSYHCVTLKLILRYAGEGTPDSLDLFIEFSLDHEAIRKRAMMRDETKNMLVSRAQDKVKLQKSYPREIQIQVYIKGITLGAKIDMLQPITLLSSFEARNDPTKCSNMPCGILDVTKSEATMATCEVVYEHKCGNDVICEPDLLTESSISFPNNPGLGELLYGVVYDFYLRTVIYNHGEPGYQAKMTIAFSSDFDVDRVEINGKSYPMWSVERARYDKRLKFVFANPIKENHKVHVAAKFSVPLLKPTNKTYNFYVEASSLGNEITPTDNTEVIEVTAKVDACVSIAGDASPSFVSVRTENNDIKVNASLEDIGTEVEYTFIVKNEAEVPVESLVANINLVAGKDDVRLTCVSDVSIDGNPCSAIPVAISCQNIAQDASYIGNSSLERIEKRSLSCSNADCISISCNIKEIHQRKGARVTVRSRLVDSNFLSVRQTVIESSVTLIFEGDRADLFVRREDCSMSGGTSLTVQVPVKQREAEQVPFWIIIVAAIGALLLLTIIILALYMRGFFARKRPNVEDEDEDEDDEEG